MQLLVTEKHEGYGEFPLFKKGSVVSGIVIDPEYPACAEVIWGSGSSPHWLACVIDGHKTKLYQNGEPSIEDGIIGLCAGGGNQVFVIEELLENNVKTLLTGVTLNNDFFAEAHNLGEKHKINIIGGTHYSTEKFACIAMVNYFVRIGLSAEFIDDVPCLEDL